MHSLMLLLHIDTSTSLLTLTQMLHNYTDKWDADSQTNRLYVSNISLGSCQSFIVTSVFPPLSCSRRVGYLHWLLWHQTFPHFLRQQQTVTVCLCPHACVSTWQTCECTRSPEFHVMMLSKSDHQQWWVHCAITSFTHLNHPPDLFMRCKQASIWHANIWEVNCNSIDSDLSLSPSIYQDIIKYDLTEPGIQPNMPFLLCLCSSRGQCQHDSILSLSQT